MPICVKCRAAHCVPFLAPLGCAGAVCGHRDHSRAVPMSSRRSDTADRIISCTSLPVNSASPLTVACLPSWMLRSIEPAPSVDTEGVYDLPLPPLFAGTAPTANVFASTFFKLLFTLVNITSCWFRSATWSFMVENLSFIASNAPCSV